MDLQELFRRLSYGELSNLAVGAQGVGAIAEDQQPRIVSFANEALLRLHSRYLLRENVLFFKQIEHLTYYYMLKRFARSQLTDPPCANTPHLYIMDNTSEPYDDDLIKVLEVIDEDSRVLPLNDAEHRNSIYTPQPNLIQVPHPVAGRIYAVNYQARHPLLSHTDQCQEIDLPYTLEGALTAYIAAKVFSFMNGQENVGQASMHMQTYESICMEVDQMDLVSQSTNQTNVKFDARGWI